MIKISESYQPQNMKKGNWIILPQTAVRLKWNNSKITGTTMNKMYKCKECQSPCIYFSPTGAIPVTCPVIILESGAQKKASWEEYKCTLIEI